MRAVAVAGAVALALACAGTSDAIARGQRYYEDNQFERALAIWRDLERRAVTLGPAERVRYAYLRGMTDYRLGYREDARHWLAIAKANRERAPGSLAAPWEERLNAALADLSRGAMTRASRDVVQTISAPPGELAVPERATPEPPGAERSPSGPALEAKAGRPDAGAPAPPAGATPGQP